MSTVNIGVIPAAGEGRRMGYLSDILPKPLFPIYDKPIIHHIIENMEKTGVKHVFIPVWHQKKKIVKYFDSIKDDINITYEIIHLNKLPPGIALTIASVEEYVNEPFITILGDDVTISSSLYNLAETFFSKKAVAIEGIVKEVNKKNIKSTCCVTLGNDNQILNITEKPKFPLSNWRGCGVYVFSQQIFEYIKKTPVSKIRNEVEITETVSLVAKDGKAFAAPITGVNININSIEDLLEAWLMMKKAKISENHGYDK